MVDQNATELRVEILRRDLRLYEVAARVGCHPSRLGQVLRGRAPLSIELAGRIRAVIREEDETERQVVER